MNFLFPCSSRQAARSNSSAAQAPAQAAANLMVGGSTASGSGLSPADSRNSHTPTHGGSMPSQTHTNSSRNSTSDELLLLTKKEIVTRIEDVTLCEGAICDCSFDDDDDDERVNKKALNLSYAEHVLFVEYDNMDITTKLLDPLFA